MAENLTPKKYIDGSNMRQILTAVKNEIHSDDNIITTEAEYLALPEEQKLNNSYYLYDIGVHYKNGVAYSRKKPIQLTMEEYKALGKVDPDQEYIVSADSEGILLGAEDIGYNNAESGIQATTVQGAIDAISNRVKSVEDDNVYSTDEQIAGIYLDGKTIYRRSLEIPLDGELQKTPEFIKGITALEGGEDISIYVNQITPKVDLSAWNIDTMIKVYGHITDYTDNTKTEKNVDIQYPITFNSQAYVTGWYSYKTKLYTVRVGEQYANKSTAFLTFEYTKV